MSRNNQGRTGAPKRPEPADVPVTPPAGGFSFATPTEFVELPTQGKYYPEGHPLHGEESIEIRYMTAKDEDILTSETLLKKGLAIERLLQSVIVNKAIDVNTLYVGDKNAILIAARITGYGNQYTTRTLCPGCSAVSEFTYDLSKLKSYDGSDWGDFNIKPDENDRFFITLPQSEVEVGVHLMTSRHERALTEATSKRKKQKLPEAILTNQMKAFIHSVNGHTDAKSIQTFINGVPASDSKYLRTAYQTLIPNVDMTQMFNCEPCGLEQEVTVPFTAAFLWPK